MVEGEGKGVKRWVREVRRVEEGIDWVGIVNRKLGCY